MRLRRGWLVAPLMLVVAFTLASCGGGSSEAVNGPDPASTQPIEGTDLSRITLSPDAAQRLDIQTTPIRPARARSGKELTEIPYAALIYDPNGGTWTYTSPEDLVFVRSQIRVDRIDGTRVILRSGPPPGTLVVSVGAPELLGIEYQVGEE